MLGVSVRMVGLVDSYRYENPHQHTHVGLMFAQPITQPNHPLYTAVNRSEFHNINSLMNSYFRMIQNRKQICGIETVSTK